MPRRFTPVDSKTASLIVNAREEFERAQAEIEKRGRARIATQLGKALTKATERERVAVGGAFRSEVSGGKPSGFDSPEIRDPLVTVRVWNGKKPSARARLRQSGPHDFRRWNQGTIRHPLFGDRGFWYETRVPAWKQMWQRSTKPVGPAIKAVIRSEMDRWFQRPTNL